jgi:hypothetical protein
MAKHKSSPSWIDYHDIRLNPHGGAILLPITLTTLAWLASISTNGCDYSQLTGPGVEMLTGSSVIPYLHLGMDSYVIPEFYPASNSWHVSIESECIQYPYAVEDNAWIVGKRFGFLSLWSGGASSMILWVGTFLVLTPRQWRGAGVLVLFAALFQVFSFAWFSTALCHTDSSTIAEFQKEMMGEVEEPTDTANVGNADPSSCTLFYGSRCAIASFFLYLISSLMILLGEYPIPEPKLFAEENYHMLRMHQL